MKLAPQEVDRLQWRLNRALIDSNPVSSRTFDELSEDIDHWLRVSTESDPDEQRLPLDDLCQSYVDGRPGDRPGAPFPLTLELQPQVERNRPRRVRLSPIPRIVRPQHSEVARIADVQIRITQPHVVQQIDELE